MNVRSRSYSALPAPLNSPQYLQAVRQEIRVLALAAGALFSRIPGRVLLNLRTHQPGFVL
jgi:hypothetical protein